MTSAYNIIKGTVITEKSTQKRTESNQVIFWVDVKANKSEIKKAVEKAFSVNVLDVNTIKMPGKVKRLGRHSGRTSIRKKAYVTLKEGDKIEFFEAA
ncbi:MAG: 50S ribosomal protein L23 [Deltaproteobacteria bacterium]|nr:50S ribosomal protein L23 [Deltaproteobacteria bacterium]